jgi:hypothetical protein
MFESDRPIGDATPGPGETMLGRPGEKLEQPRDDEDRLAIVYVDPNLVLDIFNHDAPYFRLFVFPKLPSDVRVVHVHADHSRRSLAFTLRSHQFARVHSGCMLPVLDEGLWEMRFCSVTPMPKAGQFLFDTNDPLETNDVEKPSEPATNGAATDTDQTA